MSDEASADHGKQGGESEEWGTRQWFEALLAQDDTSAASYFSHSFNGYEKYRHAQNLHLLDSAGLVNKEGLKILDIGSAEGDFSELMRDRYVESMVVGMDFLLGLSQRAARCHPHVLFTVSALPDIPFRNDSFDVVVLSEMLYYLRSDHERLRAIEQVYRTLRADGLLLFTSYLDGGRNYFSKKGTINLISAFFEIEEISYEHHRLHHLLARQLERIARTRRVFAGDITLADNDRIRDLVQMVAPIPMAGKLVQLGATIAAEIALRLLSYEWVPRMLNELSEHYLGARSITNIAIIARKYH